MQHFAYHPETHELKQCDYTEVPEGFVLSPLWINQQSWTRARKVYHQRSRAEAVRAHCIECCGTSQQATKCEAKHCPLWTFRPGAKRGELPPGVPNKQSVVRLGELEQEGKTPALKGIPTKKKIKREML